MAQSLNSTVELTTTGVSYLGMGGKVGKFLLGNKGLEFYSNANVEDYIQIPWENIEKIGNSEHLQCYTVFRLRCMGIHLRVADDARRNAY